MTFFLLLTLPSLRNKPTAEQPRFFEPVSSADIDIFIYTTDECGCLCLILVTVAAVWLDRKLKNLIICHRVCLPNRVFVKIVTLGEECCDSTAGLNLLLKSSLKVQFSLASLFYDPRQKGEAGQRKHPHQKEGSFGSVGGRKLVDSRLTERMPWAGHRKNLMAVCVVLYISMHIHDQHCSCVFGSFSLVLSISISSHSLPKNLFCPTSSRTTTVKRKS